MFLFLLSPFRPKPYTALTFVKRSEKSTLNLMKSGTVCTRSMLFLQSISGLHEKPLQKLLPARVHDTTTFNLNQ